ncbi:MAG: tyrosine-type recombinase/integrase [Dermatophilus congolensis]|nr:tyrosine-type recombinase/integrase [Dermatophilus congolensis]
MSKRRDFGKIRRLNSGRWQASFVRPDGMRQFAPDTFARKGDASIWLSERRAELVAGDWIDPSAGRILLRDYAPTWIRERRLAIQTRDNYRTAWRLHIEPVLGSVALADITPARVRSWRSHLLANGRSEGTTAKAYRLLRAILNTAVDDERIKSNPCRIKGASDEAHSSRHVASVPQVYALADAVGGRYRVFILAAAFTGLRWAELVALRRSDLDLDNGLVYVRRAFVERTGGPVAKLPKGEKVRVVTLPNVLVVELTGHLAEYVEPDASALVFAGAKGCVPRRSSWRTTARWAGSRDAAGLPKDFHFHDLRHTGNHLMAQSGASTRELMDRMGHSTMRAALIYQHATHERAHELATRLDELVVKQRGKAS